jgi:hypothetical protein
MNSIYNLVKNIYHNNDKVDVQDAYYGIGDKGFYFGMISQANLKYMKMLGRKAIYVKDFYKQFLSRKIDKIVQSKYCSLVNREFNNVHNYFKLKGFENVSKQSNDKVDIIVEWIDNNKTEGQYLGINEELITSLFGINLSDNNLKNFEHYKELKSLLKLTEKAEPIYKYIHNGNGYSLNSIEDNKLIMLLKLGVK